MRYRVASLINPAGVPVSPRGRAYKKLVSQYDVIEAAKKWRAMPESEKARYAHKYIYVSENPCGRGRYRRVSQKVTPKQYQCRLPCSIRITRWGVDKDALIAELEQIIRTLKEEHGVQITDRGSFECYEI